jgi:hypothetical protein
MALQKIYYGNIYIKINGACRTLHKRYVADNNPAALNTSIV